MNRYESNLLNTGRDAWKFLDEVGRADVSIHLDTYHMNIEESDLFQPFLDTQERLGYVHIGESHRGYLGTGSVDFDTAFRALDRIGYDGPIVFESFSSAVVSPTLSNTLGHLAQSVERLRSPRGPCEPVHQGPSRRGPHHRASLTLPTLSCPEPVDRVQSLSIVS